MTLVTLATVVMGGDYLASMLFPGLGAILSLNRVLFLGIIIYDFLAQPSKYYFGGPIYVAYFLIMFSCIPFLFFVEAGVTGPNGAFNEFTGLLGTFVYMLFFYVNCRDTTVASRISVILFLCSTVIIGYVLCARIGIVGEIMHGGRGGVYYSRLVGFFDPNIIMIYMISCFAFGPLLAMQSRFFSGFWRESAIIAVICLGLFAVLQLNSRSGAMVMAAALCVSMMFRFFSAPRRKLPYRSYTIFFVILLILIPIFLQWKYGIFDTIIAIYGVTHLDTDSSFSIRLIAYQYLVNEFSGPYLPHLCGALDGYSKYWIMVGGPFNPHCTLADMYIKGGLIYLCVYIYLFVSSIVRCFIGMLRGENARMKAIFAGFLAYLVGFSLMMMTLSIESDKMPWGILGCSLGFAAHLRRRTALAKIRTIDSKHKDNAACIG